MRIAVLALLFACHRDPMLERLDTSPRKLEFRDPVVTTELANGLKVAVLPDRRTNLVSVNVRHETGGVELARIRARRAEPVDKVSAETEAVRTMTVEAFAGATKVLDRSQALIILRGPKEAVDRGFAKLGIEAARIDRSLPNMDD